MAGVNVGIQRFPPDVFGCCLAFLQVSTSHNDPSACDAGGGEVVREADADDGSRVGLTSPGQLMRRLPADAGVGPRYNHGLSVKGRLTGTPAPSDVVSMESKPGGGSWGV